jgi:hypothetical protein
MTKLEKKPPIKSIPTRRNDGSFLRWMCGATAALALPLYAGACAHSTRISPKVEIPKQSQSEPLTVRSKVMLKDVAFPGNPWPIIASSDAFHGLGFTLSRNKRQAESLFSQKELNVLYPASGKLLSPNDLLFNIAENSVNLEQVNFIYTEVDPKTYDAIDKNIEIMVNSSPNLSGLEVSEEKFDHTDSSENVDDAENIPKKKTIIFVYTTEDGRKVTFRIEFQYKMYGENYYSKEDQDKADIVISHDMVDPGWYSPHAAIKMLLESMDEKSFEKPHYLVIEYRDPVALKNTSSYTSFLETPHQPGVRINYSNLGEIVAISKESYGCGANHRKSLDYDRRDDYIEFNAAAVIKLDNDLLKALYYAGEDALTEYAELTSFYIARADYVEDQQSTKKLSEKIKKFIKIIEKIPEEKTKQKVRKALMVFYLDLTYAEALKDDQISSLFHDYFKESTQDIDPVYDFGADFEDLFESGSYQLKIHTRALVVAYYVAVKYNDKILLERVKTTVKGYLPRLSQHLAYFWGSKDRNVTNIKELGKTGIFVSNVVNMERLGEDDGFSKANKNAAFDVLASLVYLGRKLNLQLTDTICEQEQIKNAQDDDATQKLIERYAQRIAAEMPRCYTPMPPYNNHEQVGGFLPCSAELTSTYSATIAQICF